MRLFLILFLLINSCAITSFKILKNGDASVLDRDTGLKCARLWTAINDEYEEEVYGPPCNIVLRYKNEKIHN